MPILRGNLVIQKRNQCSYNLNSFLNMIISTSCIVYDHIMQYHNVELKAQFMTSGN